MKRLYTFRECFQCDRRYPLILFKKDKRKYQVAWYKGHNACCRFCNAARVFSGQIIVLENDKHKLIQIKPTWLNAIKQFFS